MNYTRLYSNLRLLLEGKISSISSSTIKKNLILKTSPKNINQRDVLVFVATKRSGHHSFIETICRKKKKYLYVNNLETKTLKSFGEKKIENIETDLKGVLKDFKNKSFVDLDDRNVRSLLLSYENKGVSNISNSFSYNFAINSCGRSGVVKQFFFLRDPINTFASLQKYIESRADPIHNLRDLALSWKEVAKFFLEKKELPQKMNNGIQNYFVTFNDFIRGKIEWKSIGYELKNEPMSPIKKISKFGGGGKTPFDKNYNTSIYSDLENRWKMLKNDDPISELFKDEELRSLSLKFYEDSNLYDHFAIAIKKYLK